MFIFLILYYNCFIKCRLFSPAAIGDNLGCFGASKKKKEAQLVQQKETASTSRSTNRTEPIRGMELLWQPEVYFL